ncbi:hypothetical protein KL918_000019 [Ogataea parapolymorpha]|uniref:Protein kinase gsk3 n=1 Tax=Ogataea parapolymorpha (strain ATCC 26012 / BCRC 20466 / JCM 22074 / NRRL Y-7560 / DL-1) TaxID=871575 RepID=W1Q7V9_OGAPD|nr:Protein kinase gsk3 [Ogataea parapolymorpha DL-1]ESW96072.1 Protein kinase gsk3 [Ogataea parapolymorpha DL-1]KAG7868008.1 hypothetical protein KL916_005314 [Ogataea parapolymorpha]KAG7869815.1 hypothetical protein KL918_000019 [Ogataea parapolymorpha]KAG7874367.1 hypothetical protein KL938_004982 [Ogataea parapolymorpha]
MNDLNPSNKTAGQQVIAVEVRDGHTGALSNIEYAQKSMVGHGSFGYVYQITLLHDNSKAAIKRVLQDKRYKNRELEIMRLINHKNIVKLLSFFYKTNDKDEQYLHLILEYIPETLYKSCHWYTSRQRTMPMLEVKLYSYQLFRSLLYIHSLGICHRDIKPQNLLIDPLNGILKLCDFGSAKVLNPAEPNVSYICSRYYRAPELIFGARNYTTKIDLWSAGCVIAELILGQPLFPGESGIDQLVEIIKILGTPTKDEIKSMNPNYMDHKFPSIKPIPLQKIFKNVEPECLELLQLVLNYSPVLRIGAAEALTCKFFDEFRAQPEIKFPNFRNYKLDRELLIPDLFDFSKRELSVNPALIDALVPAWKRDQLDFDLDSFVPYSAEELLDPAIN